MEGKRVRPVVDLPQVSSIKINNMENNTFWKLVGVGIVVLAIGGVYIGYQQGVAIPRERIASEERQARLDREDAQQLLMKKQFEYDNCIEIAYDNYSTNWNTSCKAIGLGDDCRLPGAVGQRWDEIHKEAQERCVTLYK